MPRPAWSDPAVAAWNLCAYSQDGVMHIEWSALETVFALLDIEEPESVIWQLIALRDHYRRVAAAERDMELAKAKKAR